MSFNKPSMIRNCILTFLLITIIGKTAARYAIVGGDKAIPDQFPYQVTVKIHDAGDVCGGGIINEQFVITAAHCIIKENGNIDDRHMTILAGTNDLHKTLPPAETIDVKKIIIPKAFNPELTFNIADIAVLKLKHPLKLSKHINKLELPKDKHVYYDNQLVTIAGWGWNHVDIEDENVDGHSTDSHLRFAEAIVTPYKHSWFPPGTDYEKQICARIPPRHHSELRGVCYGDSGSPLVYHDGKTIVGIQSISPWDCSEINIAATYTRVTYYLDFIHHAMQDTHDKYQKDLIIHEFP